MKVLTVVGARPQFIKAAPVSRELRRVHEEFLVHTGQHYDDNMSSVFFRELGIPEPDEHLGAGSGSHGSQTAHMLVGIERAIVDQRPDAVLVYGDTNSTLAGALAAAKLAVPVAHVEAGLRSYVRDMPEEINRIVADHVATLRFCPSPRAAANLSKEGITRGVHVVGDVMLDALEHAASRAESQSNVLERIGVEPPYVLATLHRAHNVDDPARLKRLVGALARIEEPVVFPIHPRTRAALDAIRWNPNGRLRVLDPVSYLDMVQLQRRARLILTDSGGVQKEAYWLGVPCVTLRDETEWTETVEAGWNALAGDDPDRIVALVRTMAPPPARPSLYGEPQASRRIVERLDALA